jgi:hypothetical protein
MIFSHFFASAMSGYVTGRTRVKWADLQHDEVVFRDTANGLVSWAVGMVLTAAFLANAAASVVSGVAKAGATTAAAATGAGVAAAGATAADTSEIDSKYFVDALFRSTQPRGGDDGAVREEAGRIIATGLQRGDLSALDRSYLAEVVSSRTGLSQAEAETRIDDVVAQAKSAEIEARRAADAARKAAVHASLWSFLALLIGAFTASYAATIGGRHRDRVDV